MYIRPVHAVRDCATLRSFIHTNPLGILTTAISDPSYPLIQSSHIPWLLYNPPESSSPSTASNKSSANNSTPITPSQSRCTKSTIGTLRGHIALANPQAKALIASAKANSLRDGVGTLDNEILVLFTSPTHTYITPKFYRSTKPATGKVAPTWNYSAVQAYGKATIFHSPNVCKESSSWLQTQIEALTEKMEREVAGHEKPWRVDEAPTDYIKTRKGAIVGIEVEIERLEGRWKMSQELAEGDRVGVVEGMQEVGGFGEDVAEMVRECAPR